MRFGCGRALLTGFLAVLLLAGPAPAAESDTAVINRCAETLRTSTDPVARTEAVRALSACEGTTVVRRLAAIVRRDDDPGLRAEAAAGLGVAPDESAVETLFTLVCEGGVRPVREALAASLAKRGVPPSKFVERLRDRRLDDSDRELLIEALGRHPEPLAAAHLESLTAEGPARLRECALMALAAHPVGKALVPSAIDPILREEKDVDLLVAALRAAEFAGDERVRRHETRLRVLQDPLVDRALDTALEFVRWRERGTGIADPEALPPRHREAVDRLHVFHEGARLDRVWGRIVQEMNASRPKFEDFRVALVVYREPTAASRKSYVTLVPFTRDAAKVDVWFRTCSPQWGNPRGTATARAIEEALDRAGWRTGADCLATYHGDEEPRDLPRAVRAAALHYAADRTPLVVHLLTGRKGDAPTSLVRLAAASRRRPIVPSSEILGGGSQK